MKKEEIKDHNTVLAILIRSADWEKGLNFVSSDTDYIQIGTWQYNKGLKTTPHIHKVVPRSVQITQEVIIVKDGRLKVDIYTEKRKFLQSLEIGKDDVLILLGGGHAFEVLTDGTKVIEVKNGPYMGAEKDRETI